MDGFFQKWECLDAVTAFGESDGALGDGLLGFGGCGKGSSRRRLGGGREREQERSYGADAKIRDPIHAWIVHRTTAKQVEPQKKWQAPKRLPFPWSVDVET